MCEHSDARYGIGPVCPDGASVATGPRGHTRRTFLQLLGGVSGAVLLGGRTTSAWASTGVSPFTGQAAVAAAMHVHASWSEGQASWDQQFRRASECALDVLFMTDHDSRALAFNYITSLGGNKFALTTTGSLQQQVGTLQQQSLRLAAESANTAPASVIMTLDPATARNRLRRSISGHVLQVTFSACQLNNGAVIEIVIPLSLHPALFGRAAGVYELRYRFSGSATAPKYTLEAGGYSGVSTLPVPTAGATFSLDLTADVAALWSNMLALDNSFYGLSFTAKSAASGSVASATLTLTIQRSRNDEASIIADQRQLVAAYSPLYSGLTVYPSGEVSLQTDSNHYNSFGGPQFMRRWTGATEADRFAQIRSFVHSQGGVVSCNHPFGYQGGPLLNAADTVALRHQVLQSMINNGLTATDILEVGYVVRGHVSLQEHLNLWDTLSRLGYFITGNGVNDDHEGKSWLTLRNGFLTGIWASTVSDTELAAALSAGRAYFRHAGKWQGGEIDLLLDGLVPMGGVAVGRQTSRRLAIYLASPPIGGTVKVVKGLVDYTGIDPSTSYVSTKPAGNFAVAPQTMTVETSTDCFFRIEVYDAQGHFVGGSNPIWCMHTQPASGVPTQRLYNT